MKLDSAAVNKLGAMPNLFVNQSLWQHFKEKEYSIRKINYC